MIIKPEIFQGFSEICAGMSTRSGGVSQPPYDMNLSFTVGDDPECVKKNRELFLLRFGLLKHN